MTEDSYTSIRRRETAELKVRDSRFIAEAVPVSSADEAEVAIERTRRREHGAAHHCTAYRVGVDGDVYRYDDDGEPSGTAGLPILRQIDAERLTNTLVIVTRYFGGTKLGTGGLLRAYGEAAGRALEACGRVRRVIFTRVNVSFEYDDTSAAMHTVNRFGAKVVDSSYTHRTELTLAVPRSDADAFRDALTEALGGRGEVRVHGDVGDAD